MILILLYSQTTLKAQSSHDTIFFPRGEIGVFDTTKKAWLKYHFFYTGGIAFIDEYESSDFKYFKTESAFNLDGSAALKINAVSGVLTGNYEEYFAHGEPKKLGQFYNGFKSGKWHEYYPNGKLAAEYFFQLTHGDSTFDIEKFDLKNKDSLKLSRMKVEWGENDLSLDSSLKYINVIKYEFPYLSPAILPIWKKYNLTGELIETSEGSRKKK